MITHHAPKRDVHEDLLYFNFDGYDQCFDSTDHTLHDVMQPGFWNSLRQRLRVSTMVECRLGSVETGITQAFIQIVDCPKTDLAGDVTISLGPVNKFEPVVAKDEEDDYAA